MTRLPHRTFLHKPCYFSGRSALAPDALSLLSFFFSFWSTRVSQLIFCLLNLHQFFFPSISIIFLGFSMVVIIFPIHPNHRSYSLLSCHARPTRTAIFVSPTHTSTQTSPLHSRLRALSCMFAWSSKFHLFFIFIFVFLFTLSLLLCP